MRMYEMFRDGNFRPDVAEAAVKAIARDGLNMVRVVVGAGHLNHPVVGPDYVTNLALFFQMCADNDLWILPNFWTGGVYPDEVVFSTSDVCHYRWDPLIDPAGVTRYDAALDTLLSLAEPYINNIHHIDLRNEIHGHITQLEDVEWVAADSLYGYQWGYISDNAAPNWRAWALAKYTDISGINSTWGSSYGASSEIPVFHTWPIALAAGGGIAANARTILTDQRAWVLEIVRAWISRHAATVRQAGFKVAQCTGSDSDTMVVAPGAVRTSDYIRQSVIGDLVDVLDFHAYGSDPPVAVAELKTLYPNKEIFHGEIHPNNPDTVAISESGIAGLCVWSTGCNPGDDCSLATHFWDNWQLTPAGESFLAAVQPQLDLFYPPPQVVAKNLTITFVKTIR